MLKMLFDKYKYVALAVLFVVYSVGVWDVSSRLTDNGYLRTALNRSEEIIQIKEANDTLVKKISGEFQTSLNALVEDNRKSQEALVEALKDPVYTQCRTTDSVQQLYKRKLKSK